MAQTVKQLSLTLYETMVRIRAVEEFLAEKVLAGEIKTPCHLYVGQEAVAAGVCATLTKRDYVFGTHRSHGHYIAKGGSIKKLIAEIYGKATGCSHGHGGSMHLIAPEVGFLGAQPIVGGTLPIATGTALASRIKKDKKVTVAFFGDGAVEEGVFHESLNFSAVKKLPILFVCENNLYSSHLHLKERRRLDNIFKHAVVHGMQTRRIDGQNVFTVFETAKQLLARVRAGEGPAFIEARTYRFRGHVGAVDLVADLHTHDIRNPQEVLRWKRRDPLAFAAAYLIKHHNASQEQIDKITQTAQRIVEQAYRFAKQSPFPSPQSINNKVFANNRNQSEISF